MLGKLRTRDRLPFLSPDPKCPLCQNADESHAHLFFNCNWSSSLWRKTRLWLKIHHNMPSLSRATQVLQHTKKGLQPKMRRVSLAVLVYLIWEERNRRILTTLANRLRLFSENFRFYFTLYCIFMKKIPWLTMLHSDWIGWGCLM